MKREEVSERIRTLIAAAELARQSPAASRTEKACYKASIEAYRNCLTLLED